MAEKKPSPQNTKGDLPEVEFDDSLLDEELFAEEFSDGYEEGYVDAKDAPEDGSVISRGHSVFEKREDTRSRLALIYTILTFLVFFFGMIIAVLDGIHRDVSIIDNLEVIIPLISGVFLGTLGFVLGYYFRKGEE
jgi:hypothetical protein